MLALSPRVKSTFSKSPLIVTAPAKAFSLMVSFPFAIVPLVKYKTSPLGILKGSAMVSTVTSGVPTSLSITEAPVKLPNIYVSPVLATWDKVSIPPPVKCTLEPELIVPVSASTVN